MMKCLRLRLGSGQSELIAGVLILSVLFTAVIPLMLHIQMSSVNKQSMVVNKAKFIQLRSEETLSLGGVAQTSQNLGSGLFPGIWINNTGTIPVTLHTLMLINRETGNPDYIIDLSEVGEPWSTQSVIQWAIINLGSTNQEPLVKGTYPTLKPGDSLLIKLRMSPNEARNYYFKVITSRGNVLPSIATSSAYIIPSVGIAQQGWKGLYMPTSGYILEGYNEIMNNSDIYVERGSNYVSYNGTPYKSIIENDPDYPGFYLVALKESEDSDWIIYRGFIGTYNNYITTKVEFNFGFYVETVSANYIDGYYVKNITCSYFNPLTPDNLSSCSVIDNGYIQSLSSSYLKSEDLDYNGVDEVTLDTISDSDWNDTMVAKIIIPKDITGADYVKVSAKINYFWDVQSKYSLLGSLLMNDVRKLRVAGVGIYELNKTSGKWTLEGYKDLVFSTAEPRTFVFSATFPLNREGIYRVAVFLIDPYRQVYSAKFNFFGSDIEKALLTPEFRIGLEHVIVEWGVSNPYFRITPTVYLIAEENASTEGIGGNEYLSKLLNLFTDELSSLGINNYVILRNESDVDAILFTNPPKNAIVINLLGGSLPKSALVSNLNELLGYIANYGWVWVNIVGAPPVNPGLEIDTKTNLTAVNASDWENMASEFNLYNLKKEVWSNYSVVESTSNLPSYVFYENSSIGRIVSGAWVYGKGYIVVNTLPPIDWGGNDPHGTDPNFATTLAVFTSLYVWHTENP